MTYLLDSNIIINHLRAESKATKILLKIEKKKINTIISVITECEILSFPKLTSQEKEKILSLLQIMISIPIDSEIAQKAAEFKRKYNIKIADALIAATAYQNNATIISFDKDIKKIKEVKYQQTI